MVYMAMSLVLTDNYTASCSQRKRYLPVKTCDTAAYSISLTHFMYTSLSAHIQVDWFTNRWQ